MNLIKLSIIQSLHSFSNIIVYEYIHCFNLVHQLQSSCTKGCYSIESGGMSIYELIYKLLSRIRAMFNEHCSYEARTH